MYSNPSLPFRPPTLGVGVVRQSGPGGRRCGERVPRQPHGPQMSQQRRVGPAGGADVVRPLRGLGHAGCSLAGTVLLWNRCSAEAGQAVPFLSCRGVVAIA